ncbi:MAG: HypC/HybG/HupF family hydrogenase formation chaperone [Actinomycetota bacterium]|nr:HypC/HybG/HupF family hydrogenase formation chaperone [Actinomycetota bacterium]
MTAQPLPTPHLRASVDSCELIAGCITCGDIAVPLTVVDAAGDHDARCRDEQGHEELVATELVGEVRPGERLLVHAGVAIERLEER